LWEEPPATSLDDFVLVRRSASPHVDLAHVITARWDGKEHCWAGTPERVGTAAAGRRVLVLAGVWRSPLCGRDRAAQLTAWQQRRDRVHDVGRECRAALARGTDAKRCDDIIDTVRSKLLGPGPCRPRSMLLLLRPCRTDSLTDHLDAAVTALQSLSSLACVTKRPEPSLAAVQGDAPGTALGGAESEGTSDSGNCSDDDSDVSSEEAAPSDWASEASASSGSDDDDESDFEDEGADCLAPLPALEEDGDADPVWPDAGDTGDVVQAPAQRSALPKAGRPSTPALGKGGPHKCEMCGKGFGHKSDMLRHKRTVHGGVKAFRCDECGKGFGQKSNMLAHKRTVHGGVKAFRCDECGKGFGQKSHMLKHKRTVHGGVKAFRCDECGKGFGQKSHMLRHKRAMHAM